MQPARFLALVQAAPRFSTQKIKGAEENSSGPRYSSSSVSSKINNKILSSKSRALSISSVAILGLSFHRINSVYFTFVIRTKTF